MKTLVLLRHAKAVSDDLTRDDRERPLNPRGQAAAPLMGAWIASTAPPDIVLVSTATRTRETYALVAPALARAIPTRFLDSLYLADAETILTHIRTLPDDTAAALVIGHNSGMEDLATVLAGHGDATLRAALADKFPTAAAAVLTFTAKRWRDVDPGDGTLAAFMTPKRLAGSA